MKHTKRLFSVLLTLCLLLGLMPTTAWAVGRAEITQQPMAGNGYTVVAEYDGSKLTEGFQWYKKLNTPTTYTLVDQDEATGENKLEAWLAYSGTCADGRWSAKEDSSKFTVDVLFTGFPGDRVTVQIPADQVSDNLIVKEYRGNVSFQKTDDGIYTATLGSGDKNIYIESVSEFTAVITVDRYWTAMAGETTSSLQAREAGSYYCQVEHVSGTMFSDTVTILSQEEQATADWLADQNHMLTLGPTRVTADNAKDILGDGTASFALVDGMPTLTLNGVSVTEGIAESGGTIGLTCSDALTIVLAEGSDNTITLTADMPMGIGIGSQYDGPASPVFLTVTGKGTLTVDVTGSSFMCIGVATKYGVQVTGGAKLTATASVPTLSECFGLWIQEEGDLQVSDGGVVRLSSTSAAAVFGGTAPQIPLEEGYSIRGSTAANNFTNLADAELKKLNEDGDILTIKVGDEVAKSVVIAPIPSHTHVWAGAWSKNDTHHWHKCTAGGCSITDYSTCGEAGAAYDDHTKVYDKDDNQHWEKCSDCGWTGTKTAHTGGTATCTAKAVCSVCGQSYGDLAAHDFTGDYLSDASGHWHKCKNCDAADTKAGHVYDNDQDTDCNTCGYTRTITPDSGVTGEVEIKPGTGTPQVSTDKKVLEELAGTPQAGETIKVKLTVEKKAENAAAGASDIKNMAAGQTVEFLDLSLVKTVTPSSGGSTDTPITDTNGKVLEIVVSYSLTGKKDVKVYRYHDGKAEALNPAKGDAKTGGTFKLGADSVTIYATKFSTYAIGYTPEGGGGNGGSSGGSGGSSGSTYHNITAAAGTGGSISPSGRVSVLRNRARTFTITPGAGYAVSDVLVDGKSVRAVTKYTFEKVTKDHTIEVKFKRADGRPAWNPFVDVAAGSWFHDGVKYIYEQGLMVGTDSTHFSPHMTTSRAMIASILWRMEGEPKAEAAQPFSDVADGRWYTQAIAWAAEAGVIKGYGEGRFGPNDPITREQLASLLWRYAGNPPASDLPLSFTDADRASGYARDALRWAVDQGILTGKGGSVLDPRGIATRAEAAQMLMRFCLSRR